MKISVVIPAFNAERHIGRALRSVLAQTRPPEEIIVVDDGSTDATPDVVRTFGQSVRLIQQPNAGASVARNAAITAARFEWIAFLDADDEWKPEKLELQADCHRQFPDLKWSFTRLEWARPEWSKRRLAHPDSSPDNCVFEDYLRAYCSGFFISTITVMIHKTAFKAVGGFEPGMKRAQDNDLWFRIAYQFPEVGYIPNSLAVYHLDTPNSSTKVNDQVEYMVSLIERHRCLAGEYNRQAMFELCARHMLTIWMRELARQGRYDDARELLRRYHKELPSRFCREMTMRLHLPRSMQTLLDFYLRTKNHLLGKR